VGTLGGYFQYKYGVFFPLVLSLWSILALSSTLAGEASRGSLEFVAATASLAGHAIGLRPRGESAFVGFASIAYAGAAYPARRATRSASCRRWVCRLAGGDGAAAGALAFALAPFVGRGAAAGISGFVTFAGFILNGYQQPVPELAPYANLTWWGWTTNHLPLAGPFDWASVVLVGVVAVVLLAIGIEAFARRDIGSTSTVLSLSMPRSLLGLSGPFSRSAAINLAPAIAWGLGVGLFGLVLRCRRLAEQPNDPLEFAGLLETVLASTTLGGGFLQPFFVELVSSRRPDRRHAVPAVR
jgi:hypothetical protein